MLRLIIDGQFECSVGILTILFINSWSQRQQQKTRLLFYSLPFQSVLKFAKRIHEMDDIAYYDSQVQYQKRVGEIEKERLQLEREMFSMMRSDKKLQNIRAVKLRSYWKQICEREEKARERNKELLHDFEEMELKLSVMETKTSKLQKMKVEYDEKVKQMYPQWRKEVEVARAKKQLQERGIHVSQTREHTLPSYDVDHAYSHTESLSPTREIHSSLSLNTPGNAASLSMKKASFESVSPEDNVKTPEQSNSTIKIAASHPTQVPVTSTPKSSQSAIIFSEQASVHAPPESFADTKPKQVDYVNVTSPMRMQSKTSDVVHTIPTAASSDEGNSDISEPSMLSDQTPNVKNASNSKLESSLESLGNIRPTSLPKPTLPSPTHLFAATAIKDKDNQSDQNSFEIESRSRHNSSINSPIKYQPSPVSAVAVHASNNHKSPDVKPGSRMSMSSFESDDLSPRSNLSPRSDTTSPRSKPPLTANAAYQALLKQHSGPKNPDSINIPSIDEESDEDDLENILSPHGTGKRSQFAPSENSDSDEDDSFSSRKDNAPVYIPTAMSSESKAKGQNQLTRPRAVPKAPWDTDTEDEFENEETYLSNTGGSSKWDQKLQKYDAQDDFDFYD
uniref:centrosomal protein kizuna-like isoform X1 n=1 Tax=Styela clava TaxID=7725 RepID=UPI00193951B1|nr:centrosomal protein kizuna-like isoform X1 [Styela clava]